MISYLNCLVLMIISLISPISLALFIFVPFIPEITSAIFYIIFIALIIELLPQKIDTNEKQIRLKLIVVGAFVIFASMLLINFGINSSYVFFFAREVHYLLPLIFVGNAFFFTYVSWKFQMVAFKFSLQEIIKIKTKSYYKYILIVYFLFFLSLFLLFLYVYFQPSPETRATLYTVTALAFGLIAIFIFNYIF